MAPTVTAARAGVTIHGPLFVVGAPRSGTSLAYRALCLHPSAAYVSNWLVRKPRWAALSVLNRIPRTLRRLQLLYWFGEESNAYRYGKPRPLMERAFPAPVEGGPLFEACGVRPGGPPLSQGQISSLRRAFLGLTRYGGGDTVVSKRITNNRSIDLLAEVFPEARFVSIVRDGRAVAYSLSRVNWWESSDLWWFGGTPSHWRAQGGDPWEACARTWVEEVRAVENRLAAVGPARVLRLSYEGLVANPVAELTRIAAFGGLDDSAAWTETLRRLEYPNRNEGWRTNLDRETTDRIERIESEELQRYGYL